MVNPNMKTPNKNKRKSLPNVEADAESPKKTKLNETLRTPGKNKNANSPKGGKTPKAGAAATNLAKTPKQTPVKVEQKNSPKAGNKKNINSSKSDDSSPKKLKKFGGTSALKSGDAKPGKKNKRKSQYTTIFEKVKAGDKEVVAELKQKIEAIESRTEMTKTARRKLKLLLKFKRIALGEESTTPSTAQKRRERKAKAGKKEGQKQVKKGNNKKVAVGVKDEDESSDYEVESEIKPGKIIKTDEESAEEESTDEDEDEARDEEEAGDGEEESTDEDEDEVREEEEAGDGEEESTDEDEEEAGDGEEESTDEDEGDGEEAAYENKKGRQINVLYTQGGKKKGQEKKNEVKAKNLKLQAMRKQGQLAGSVKASQKRSARRAKQNAVKTNGSS